MKQNWCSDAPKQHFPLRSAAFVDLGSFLGLLVRAAIDSCREGAQHRNEGVALEEVIGAREPLHRLALAVLPQPCDAWRDADAYLEA